MESKAIKIIIVLSISALITIGAVLAVLTITSGDKIPSSRTSFPWLYELEERTATFRTDSPEMILDQERKYFAVYGPGNEDEIALILDMRITITWSDDDGPALGIPWTYDNMDTFDTFVRSDPIDRNWSNEDTASGRHELINMDLIMTLTPGMVRGRGSDDWSLVPVGTSEPDDTTTFISAHCIIGEDNYRNLMYEDPGDEIEIEISVKYSMFPYDHIAEWAPG